MKKETNPKVLGAFVLGAIALIIMTVLTFGADQLFQERRTFVMFFDGSLNGLQDGAPVRFRGINIGKVTDIKVILDHKTNELYMPVYAQITPDSVQEINLSKKQKTSEHQVLNELIQRGLRARLALQSIVTGMLYVELDLIEDAPLNYVKRDPRHPEIPTIPSKTEELSSMLNTGQEALEQIRDFMKSPKLRKALDDISDTMHTGKDAMVDIQGAAASGRKMLDTGEVTFKDAQKMIQYFNDHIEPVGSNLEKVLHDLSDTLNTVRVLADYLSRHPEALVKGKSRHHKG